MFEVEFENLESEHVQTFLDGVSGEGLIWEAKGTASLRELKPKIIAGVGGLANQLGGYFVVGATEANGTWTFDGVEDDCGEDPHDWIARILNGNLSEPPPFEIRTFTLDNGRVGAVIRVTQTATPPCMTNQGLIYVRVVGETLKVKDPRLLSELVARGESARLDAEKKAAEIARQIVHDINLIGDANCARFALALAPTAADPDYSGRIFTPDFKQSILGATDGLELAGIDGHVEAEYSMTRDRCFALRGRVERQWGWAIQATWNGVVAVGFACQRDGAAPPYLDDIIEQAWRAAALLLPNLTGIRGTSNVPTFLALRLTGDTFQLRDEGTTCPETDRPIQRWATMNEPTEVELKSIVRELARSVPYSEVFEPE
jgi:schlafen family protein